MLSYPQITLIIIIHIFIVQKFKFISMDEILEKNGCQVQEVKCDQEKRAGNLVFCEIDCLETEKMKEKGIFPVDLVSGEWSILSLIPIYLLVKQTIVMLNLIERVWRANQRRNRVRG
ncbi:unnamed protein product [Caenorhabditis angaria]|uniref:Uncharacterized protein n=1 Tax=Caenorhabditis angaria TaxID=860376 RepID=A0A9P1IUS4_9PELO|nr:unnamed protein product [Caenorhabditis angaria]